MTDTQTKYGTIHHGGPCKDDYDNIRIYVQHGGAVVKLQGPAMRSFKAAEQRITPRWMKRRGKTRHIILTGIAWRSCALQRQLWEQDPNRFANPDVTLHTRGLAVDVSTAQSRFRQRRIRRALTAEGWNQVRPDDEPWHYSYHLTA